MILFSFYCNVTVSLIPESALSLLLLFIIA